MQKEDIVTIKKIEIFLGRIDNFNGSLFYKTHPYWELNDSYSAHNLDYNQTCIRCGYSYCGCWR